MEEKEHVVLTDGLEEYFSRHGKKRNYPKTTIGKKINMVILDFQNPEGPDELYDDILYFEYDCFVHSKDNQEINNRYFVRIPSKTAWCQLYEELKYKNLLDKKNIQVEIIKLNNKNYTFIIGGAMTGSTNPNLNRLLDQVNSKI